MPRPASNLPETRAMIVAPQPEAVEAGAAVLAAGGNAVDAVLACAFTQGVVDPLMCGIGGQGVLQIHDPASQRTEVFEGLATCPAACTPAMWERAFQRECPDGFGFVLEGYVNELGHGAVGTPGILRMLADVHRAYGRAPWAGLFDAAIAFAEDGWIVRPHVAGVFATDERVYGRLPYRDKLAFTKDGAALYLRQDGTPKRLGDTVRNPDLAATLRGIAADGADALYTGAIGARIVADMRARGGLLSGADLAGFAARRGPPLSVRYRGRTITMPRPPAGGIVVAEMLRILEGFDLVALGHNTPAAIAVLAEAMKIAGRDKDEHIGDPDFVPPPLDRLLSGEYAADCAARIRSGEKARLTRVGADAPHTTTVSCIDAGGMVVSLTHTLGVPSGVIPPGLGFMLNGAMSWYDPRPGHATSIAPGKRRFSTMSPTIVFEGGTPVATLGAPGGPWIGVAILQVLLNVLDWGMTMQESVMAPRVSATSDAIDISNRIPRATQRALEAMGYPVQRSAASYAFAGVHGIARWDGVLEGGADPQRDGYVATVA